MYKIKIGFLLVIFENFLRTMQKNNVPLHGVVGPCGVVHQSLIFWGKKFNPKDGENGPRKGQNKGFLNILENLVFNFF